MKSISESLALIEGRAEAAKKVVDDKMTIDVAAAVIIRPLLVSQADVPALVAAVRMQAEYINEITAYRLLPPKILADVAALLNQEWPQQKI